jgi:hypothetical protein
VINIAVAITVTTTVSSLPLILAKLQEIEEQPAGGGAAPSAVPEIKAAPPGETAPASLTEAQGRLFVENCSAKTLAVLRAILDGRPHPFRLSALTHDLSVGIGDVGWVWGGLTKRVRNIMRDRNARLIVWRNHLDATGKWVDADGTMADTTVASLRKALSIPSNGLTVA